MASFPEGGSALNLDGLTESILRGMYPNVTSFEIDTLAAETAASMATQHMLYAKLAAYILVAHNHKITPPTFSEAIQRLTDETGYIESSLVELVKRRAEEINAVIHHDRDLELTYFGFKTLERSYLLKGNDGKPIERPQYLMMRVALGIHCTNSTAENENERLQAAFQTYDLLSQGYFTHASPTLFHSGTTHPQLSSCFLLQMSDDSIHGIYDTLKRCAVISKAAGGIGLSVHNVRARGSPIQGTRGVSNGLVPMLRVFDVTSRYVDQGGGKRPGAFAIYIEPWHADILDVLNLKKNHGKEENRARDLFYGLWIPDLFMKRVENDELWSLMCPDQCPGLSKIHGKEFEDLYCQYENEGRFVKQMRAREVWNAILESQIETGTPYMLYKDAANIKSNQKNLGTIQCSNLCTEIIQYTDHEEVAVCNLASMYVSSDQLCLCARLDWSAHQYFLSFAVVFQSLSCQIEGRWDRSTRSRVEPTSTTRVCIE
jgi:ribonucleoside-diphosphate reductase subunit M1